jgi:hypothetical protein
VRRLDILAYFWPENSAARSNSRSGSPSIRVSVVKLPEACL